VAHSQDADEKWIDRFRRRRQIATLQRAEQYSRGRPVGAATIFVLQFKHFMG
jgi:hypothetical protein